MEDARVELLILDFAGVCTPSAHEIVADEVAEEIEIRPEISGLVATARAAGVATAILSNEISLDWQLSTDLFDRVDHVVRCADNGIYKPDRRAFQRCLLLTGSAAERTVVVDDDPDNIAVAISLGMCGVQFLTDDVAGSIAKVSALIS